MGRGRSISEEQTAAQTPLLSSFLIFFGLWGFAVAEPVFGLLGNMASFFVAHRADGTDLLLFALLLCLPVPLACAIAVGVLRAIKPPSSLLLEGALWTALCALIAARWLRDWTVPAVAVVICALVAGVLAGALLARFARARQLASWLGAASVVFPLLFLFQSPVRGLWAADDSTGAVERHEPVADVTALLVIFDEFPVVSLMTADQEIDAGRYPHFGALAETSTWYRNATTVAQSTTYAVPAMLTSRMPIAGSLLQPTLADHDANLFTMLGPSVGMNVLESITSLCPESICAARPDESTRSERLIGVVRDSSAVYLHEVTPAAWRGRLPVIDASWRDFWDVGAADPGQGEAPKSKGPMRRFEGFLSRIEEHPSPALHYLHIMQPHMPWKFLPSGQSFRVRGMNPHGLKDDLWKGSEWETLQARQRHLLNVGFVDELLGLIRARLEELGRWEDAIVVITSDHGSSFSPGVERRTLSKGLENLVELVNVPLFIKWPGQREGMIDDSHVETIDVLPSILDAFDLPKQPGSQGSSLRSAERRSGPKRTFVSGKTGEGAGEPISYALADLVRLRPAAIAARTPLGYGDWGSLYRVGPHAELLGRSLDSLSIASDSDRPRVRLDSPFAFDVVDPDAYQLPIHVAGALDVSPGEGPLRIAIALNAVVQGVTETFADSGGLHFTSLLPPDALVVGHNRLELFEVDVSGAAVTLRPLKR